MTEIRLVGIADSDDLDRLEGEGIMRSGKNYWSILALSLMLLLVITTGCSNLSPLGSNQVDSPAGNSSSYPPITEEFLLNGPEPGHPVLTIERPPNTMGVENWDYAEGWVMWDRGGDVFTGQGSGCMIAREALPQDTLITVTLPMEGYAIVDFGPHPLQFQRQIWIVMSLNGTGIRMHGGGPKERTVDPQPLNIYYYNEETGEYEVYPSTYDPVRNALMFRTDHFSRYIIA